MPSIIKLEILPNDVKKMGYKAFLLIELLQEAHNGVKENWISLLSRGNNSEVFIETSRTSKIELFV